MFELINTEGPGQELRRTQFHDIHRRADSGIAREHQHGCPLRPGDEIGAEAPSHAEIRDHNREFLGFLSPRF